MVDPVDNNSTVQEARTWKHLYSELSPTDSNVLYAVASITLYHHLFNLQLFIDVIYVLEALVTLALRN